MKQNNEQGTFNGPGELRMVRTLPGPIERVWAYLTDAEKRARWFAGGPLEQRVGGKVQLHFRHRDISPNEVPPKGYEVHHDPGHSMEGIVTRCEPPHLLAFTFGSDGDSEVTFELKEEGNNVILVLTHRAKPGDVPYMSEFGGGWHSHTALLIAELEGRERPPFWSTFVEAKANYGKAHEAASAP